MSKYSILHFALQYFLPHSHTAKCTKNRRAGTTGALPCVTHHLSSKRKKASPIEFAFLQMIRG